MKVLHWKDDPAGANIAENLKHLGLGDLCIETEKSLLYSTEPEVKTDFFVVASTHRSEMNKRSLTVHPTGNWGPADVGGGEHEISRTNPGALAVGLRALEKNKISGFEVCMEATHHGPTDWKTPLIFIEIGSSEKEWKNKKAGEAVAKTIAEINDNPNEFENYVGFGGLHYCPSFTQVLLRNENIAIGHIATKYAVPFLDKEIVQRAFEKSNAEVALFDWKGLKSEERNKVLNILDELGIDFKKTKEM